MNDYPQTAVDTAQSALDFRDANPDMDCGTRVGWTRANQIANREMLSEDVIRRTFAFLSRGKTFDTGSFTDEDGNYSCGSIMYAAWGGDSMLEWSRQIVEQINEEAQSIEIKGGIGAFYNDAEYFDYKVSQLDSSKPLNVYIDSLGGSFYDAISMYHTLSNYKGHTTAIYSGLCASAATIVAAGCNEIVMTDASAILIHKVMNYVDIEGYLNGDDIQDIITQLKKVKKDTDTLSSLAASIYAKKTGKTVEEMLKQMKSDSWILPEDAMQLGLVDRIVETQSTKAQDAIEQLQNKIQSVEMANSVSLPSIFNKTKTEKKMNLLDNIKNWFLNEGQDETTASEKAAALLASIEDNVKSHIQNNIKQEVEGVKAEFVSTATVEDVKATITTQEETLNSTKEQIAALKDEFKNELVELQTTIKELRNEISAQKLDNRKEETVNNGEVPTAKPAKELSDIDRKFANFAMQLRK